MQVHPLELQEAHRLEEYLEEVSQDFLVAVELDCLVVLAATAFCQVQLERSTAHPVLGVDQELQGPAVQARCQV